MATTKTIQPTGTTITMPAMTDKPNASVFSTDVDRITDAVNSLNSKFSYESERPTTYDTDKITEVFGIRNGNVVLVRVTIKAGLATTWHNDIVTGLSSRYFPPTGVFGSYRVNASADIVKNAVCILGTNGTVQFLCDQTYVADIPFVFVFPTTSL